jgi:hypothetical protein
MDLIPALKSSLIIAISKSLLARGFPNDVTLALLQTSVKNSSTEVHAKPTNGLVADARSQTVGDGRGKVVYT